MKIVVASALGEWLVRLLGVTWRVRWEGSIPTGPVVLAMWHGELLPLVWALRGRGIAPLVSTHADGEVIARIVRRLGFDPIRGSSSRGGARALIEAARRLEAGATVAFTTDGPRGPRRQSAPGALAAAARSGLDVVPMGALASRAWRFKSWDRFVVPQPFAVITIRCGAPLRHIQSGDTARLDAALLAVSEPDAPNA
ncbi:MAG: lysophospholipid acyltransferase family protein [Gemmatimonadetes bacterium]|nr:lysophospholipid acyltransferase family protein [Gemmatimonadota bacterium]